MNVYAHIGASAHMVTQIYARRCVHWICTRAEKYAWEGKHVRASRDVRVGMHTCVLRGLHAKGNVSTRVSICCAQLKLLCVPLGTPFECQVFRRQILVIWIFGEDPYFL